MPPHSTTSASAAPHMAFGSFESSFLQQHQSTFDEPKPQQLASPEWSPSELASTKESTESSNNSTEPYRLNVKTHVFKKELQEYVPTQLDDRLRIETIIYVELSIVDQADGSLVRNYDYVRLPKELFFTQPDKEMTAEEMASKRILNVDASLQCPSNNWQVETEACVRCARRMSAKLEQNESRIIHMIPELYRAENGDALVSFRSGVANLQFKVNCYCGHKKEKEGFVIRFDSMSDDSIASHLTLPLMFYHQNKNRIISRALAAEAKAKAKAEQLLLKAQARMAGKSATKAKRVPRSKASPQQHHIPSPPSSSSSSPMDYSLSPDLGDFMDTADMGYKADAPPPPDPLAMISLFPELTNETSTQQQQQSQSQQQQQQQAPQQVAIISHMTPSTGPTRGGTLVTVHGSGFTVGEMIYVCFGEILVPVIPQHHHMLECFTPAATKAETVAVFALQTTTPSNIPAQATFTYVDDNEKELMKLALQRMMNISARMDGPVDSVLTRANDFALWNDLLNGSSSASSADSTSTYQNLENMVMDSFKLLDTPVAKNTDGLSITNMTGHTMLHLSVPLQYQDLAKDLIDRGIDLTIQDKNGLTALNWAQRFGDQAMIDLIAEAASFEATPLQSKEDVAMIAHQAAGNDKAVHYRGHHMEAAQSLMSMENRGHPNLYEGNSSSYSGLNSPPSKIIDSSPLQSLAPVTIRDHPNVAAVYEHKGHCGVAPDVTANVLPPPTVGVQHSDPGMDFEWSGSPPVAAAKSTMMMSAIPSVGPLPLLRDDGVEQAAPIQAPGLPRVITRVPPPSPTDIIDTGRMNVIDVVVRDRERVLLPVETQLEVASLGQDFRWVARGAEAQVVVVRRNSNDVGGSVDAAEQAVVQSSRYDVESESVLFLGGMPVVVAPRATAAATTSVNGTALSNARQERDSPGSAPSHQGNGSHEMNDA
ncbi:SPT3 Dosage dependent suppressor of Ty-induced promoter mutations-like protein [Linnemannia schmuckeri]|uniref:SPT3 Dosage dependent suppressor of Ty-induced promoter mutations-like protein n=1 Tax=Linnemannia schmuckeri TaxID=64567 RepID=A0A9P5V650_9FUNG|nr:SPT3 Dosage dependent suppressor of Ty-induced promoter mutations-like protein [Linnemannia schmuckeri]